MSISIDVVINNRTKQKPIYEIAEKERKLDEYEMLKMEIEELKRDIEVK